MVSAGKFCIFLRDNFKTKENWKLMNPSYQRIKEIQQFIEEYAIPYQTHHFKTQQTESNCCRAQTNNQKHHSPEKSMEKESGLTGELFSFRMRSFDHQLQGNQQILEFLETGLNDDQNCSPASPERITSLPCLGNKCFHFKMYHEIVYTLREAQRKLREEFKEMVFMLKQIPRQLKRNIKKFQECIQYYQKSLSKYQIYNVQLKCQNFKILHENKELKKQLNSFVQEKNNQRRYCQTFYKQNRDQSKKGSSRLQFSYREEESSNTIKGNFDTNERCQQHTKTERSSEDWGQNKTADLADQKENQNFRRKKRNPTQVKISEDLKEARKNISLQINEIGKDKLLEINKRRNCRATDRFLLFTKELKFKINEVKHQLSKENAQPQNTV